MATKAEGQETKSPFSPKEQEVLQHAWSCMISGPPELDMDRLVKLCGFNTVKTAKNTWGVVKKKLAIIAEQNGVEVNKAGPATASPTRSASISKKRTKATKPDDEGDAVASPAKKRKVAAKKTGSSAKASAGDSDSALSDVDEDFLAKTLDMEDEAATSSDADKAANE